MANHLNQSGKAFSYFMKTARLDIEDHQGNTDDGLHFANMAGTWMALTAGYLGMKRKADGLSFTPHIPEKWEYYTLRVHYQNSLLGIRVEQEKVIYEMLEGESISFKHMDEQIELTSENKAVELTLIKDTQNHVDEIKAAIFDVDGRHIRHSKPNPEVFIKAGEALGIAPENCIVFEDAVAGIEAANAANMRSIAMGHIAPDFLKLGAQAGAWTLEDVFAEDLSNL